jgi:(2Fe-2S) ferredoxin
MVAGRYRGFAERQCVDAVRACARAYREKLAEYADWPMLDVWYARIDAEQVVEIAVHAKQARRPEDGTVRSAANMSARLLPKLTEVVGGKRRIKDEPPLVYHPQRERAFSAHVRAAIHRYRESLPPERRALVNHYEMVDAAVKVVGVGSVGTLCAVALLQANADDSLFLQIKQARSSVLAPYAGSSAYRNQAERVVIGQRLMQSASDVFLGWSRIGKPPIDIYFRQLRDIKVSVNLDSLLVAGFIDYAHYCGWAVARAHAKTGDAAVISGYLGSNDAFDEALRRFARAYADQTEKDHAALVKAIKSGRIRVEARIAP